MVHDLYKKYKKGNVLANNNISLQVNQGEILGLLGANGAGKTTLVRQITTEVIPTSGSIKVFGIDVEPQVIERGTLNVINANLRIEIELKLIKPGLLPFSNEEFDVVFSKDSLIHIEDKAQYFREILRVLKPAGIFAASDWLTSDNSGELPEFKKWIETSPHKFAMQTKVQAETAMREAGFANVLAKDKNDWYVDLSLVELELMEGTLREKFLKVCGEDGYQETVSYTNLRDNETRHELV